MRRSTVGRRRVLSDEAVAAIFRWHADVQELKAHRAKVPTERELARALGVTRGAITSTIRRKGQFKRG